jgi:hypothetical protein
MGKSIMVNKKFKKFHKEKLQKGEDGVNIMKKLPNELKNKIFKYHVQNRKERTEKIREKSNLHKVMAKSKIFGQPDYIPYGLNYWNYERMKENRIRGPPQHVLRPPTPYVQRDSANPVGVSWNRVTRMYER